jgi:hypothetical protein
MDLAPAAVLEPAKRMKLYEIDLERLGRFERNRRCGSRRRKAHNSSYWNQDRAIGAVL